MARDINVVVLTGRLADDATLKQAAGQALATFKLASDKPRKKQDGQWVDQSPNYFTVLLWGQLAETLKPYLTRGKQVAVTGRLQQRSYKLPDEARSRSVVEVVASEVQLLGGGRGEAAPPPPPPEDAETVPEGGGYPPAGGEVRSGGGWKEPRPSFPADRSSEAAAGGGRRDGGVGEDRLEPPAEDPFVSGGGEPYGDDDLPF